MKVRTLLTTTAVVSSILGATVAYLVLTVPNDLAAESLLKKAKAELQAGRSDPARASLTRIIQQYPRTDAAAAATIALAEIDRREIERLGAAVALLQKNLQQQNAALSSVQQSVGEIKAAPPPAPVVVQAPARKTPPRKKGPPRRSSRRRRR